MAAVITPVVVTTAAPTRISLSGLDSGRCIRGVGMAGGLTTPRTYSAPAYYSPPPYYAPPPQQQSYTYYSSQPDNAWYYCAASNAYYPYVTECPGGQWERVQPQAPPPGSDNARIERAP